VKGMKKVHYIPMTMTFAEASAIIDEENVSLTSIGEIERIISREQLTPQQAQAVLTTAWSWVISQGRIADRRE